jgi:restriction endonuclease S subunit
MEWEQGPLSKFCVRITDGSHFSPKTGREGYPYITVRDLTEGVIDFTGSKKVDVKAFELLSQNGCQPKRGDVLFSKDGTVGKVALVSTDEPFVVLSSLAIISPHHDVLDPEYLCRLLESPTFLSEATGRKTGTALRRIILKDLKSIPIAVPPMAEQRRIVELLDRAFAAISDAREAVARKLDALSQLRGSLLHEAFLGRLA